jgi:hypothetical protein
MLSIVLGLTAVLLLAMMTALLVQIRETLQAMDKTARPVGLVLLSEIRDYLKILHQSMELVADEPKRKLERERQNELDRAAIHEQHEKRMREEKYLSSIDPEHNP